MTICPLRFYISFRKSSSLPCYIILKFVILCGTFLCRACIGVFECVYEKVLVVIQAHIRTPHAIVREFVQRVHGLFTFLI